MFLQTKPQQLHTRTSVGYCLGAQGWGTYDPAAPCGQWVQVMPPGTSHGHCCLDSKSTLLVLYEIFVNLDRNKSKFSVKSCYQLLITLVSVPHSPGQVWEKHLREINISVESVETPPLEFFFEEQSYSSLHSGRCLAWDHVRGDIDDPCGAIADFCGVIANPCGVVVIHEAIGGRRCGNADRCVTR